MSISAKELARQLGISAAAVSMALNDKPGVSEATRDKVLSAARRQNYDFGKIKAAPSKRGRLVFVIFQKHGAVVGDTPFFSSLTEGILRSGKELGYTVDVKYILDTDKTRNELRALLDAGTDGLILLGTEMRAGDFSAFQELPIPVVVLDTYFEGLDKNCVLINNVQGAYMATSFLIATRHSQPGYLRSSYSIGNFDERADGFYKAVRKNGMSPSGSVVHLLAPSVEGAYADMRELLARGEKTADCYFADNDLIAAGAMRALKEAGYRIPEDVGIVGFDNTTLCELLDPPLTTVNVPKLALGRLAVERLCAMLRSSTGEVTKTEVLTSLVRRASH